MKIQRKMVPTIICLAATLLAAVGVMAQEKAQKPARDVVVEGHEVMIQAAPGVPLPPDVIMNKRDANTFVFVSSEMSFGGKTVKGAPYSAQAVTESVQVLTDGNRITRKNTAAVYRDSEGRTRREQTLEALGPWSSAGEPVQMIHINDPVANVAYMLDPRDKTARKMLARVGPKPGENFKIEGERVRVGAQDSGPVFERRVPPPGVGGGMVHVYGNRESAEKPKIESLGKQVIEGVEAEGTRTTITIPAGQIGNELPINIVSETWYSTELQTVVLSKHSDPRAGETTYRLTGINRAEPAKALFEVPADYTFKEGGPADVRIRKKMDDK
jgi:hypothetical protein